MPRIRLSGMLICTTEEDDALVRRYLPPHIELTRAEPGCLEFEVRPSGIPGVWRVQELFSSRHAFDAHQQRVRTSEWGDKTQHIERSYTIEEIPDATA